MHIKVRLIINIVCLIGIFILGWFAYIKLRNPNYDEMGKIAYSKKDYKNAVYLFTKAIEKNPRNADAYWNLGNTYASGRFFHHYHKFPHQTYVQAGLKDEERAFEKTVEAFKKAMEIDSSYTAISHFGLGNAYYLYYDSYDDMKNRVIPEYQKALKNQGQLEAKLGKIGLAMLYANLGRTYLEMGELGKAYKAYAKSISIKPLGIAMGHMIRVCFGLGKYEEAYRFASNYIKMRRKNYSVMDMALASYRVGKYGEALNYANELIEKFPNFCYIPEVYRLRAVIYKMKGETKLADSNLTKAASICSEQIRDPNTSPGHFPGVYFERGLDYYTLGRYRKTMENFQYLIEHPEISDREHHGNAYLEAHIALAYTYSALGKNQKAVDILKETLEIISNDPELQGWRKYRKSEVQALLRRLQNGEKVSMLVMFQ
ncbi:MAG: tetratricopeptide repeat protein [Nitrospiraceae bacterium]|nr:tetratricopeptide repeat protein [Nitrospiraceae bacterium]